MRPGLLRRAKQFVDVALSIADMNAPARIIQKLRRLLEVFQPPNTFLLLDRNPRWIDLSLERERSLEFVAGPEFDRPQPQRKPFSRDRQA